MTMVETILLGAFLAGTLSAGLWCLGLGFVQWYHRPRSDQWATVVGKIDEVWLAEAMARPFPGLVQQPTYLVEVRYQYRVDGEKFVGRTIHEIYAASTQQEQHQVLLSKLKSDDYVQVHYRKDQPENSALGIELAESTRNYLAGGIFLCGIPLSLVLLWFYLNLPPDRLLRQIEVVL